MKSDNLCLKGDNDDNDATSNKKGKKGNNNRRNGSFSTIPSLLAFLPNTLNNTGKAVKWGERRREESQKEQRKGEKY